MTTHRARRGAAATPSPQLLADLLAARLAVAGPAPEFSDRLRGRLLAVATVSAPPATRTPARPAARPAVRRGWLPRLVVGGAAGVVAVAGVGVGTSRALPGQPLYDAKRQVESWQLALRHGSADRGREELAFARTRLAEVTAMSRHHTLTSAGGGEGADAGASTDARIARTLRTMDDETRSGARDLTTAARGGDDAAASALLAFTDAQTADLDDVRAALPAAAAPAVAASTALLAAVRTQAATLPGGAGAGSAAGPPAAPTTSPTPHATATPVAPSPASAAPTTAPAESSAAPVPSDDPTTTPTATTSPPTSATTSEPAEPTDTPTSSPTASPAPQSGTAAPSDLPSIALPLPTITLGPIVLGATAPAALVRPTGSSWFARLIERVLLVLHRTSQG